MRSEHKDILSALAFFFLEHDQPDKALTLLEALRTVFPEDPSIAKSVSYAYLQVGRPQDALDAAGPTSAGQDGACHLLRGKALWGLGRVAEARACLDQYLATRRLQ